MSTSDPLAAFVDSPTHAVLLEGAQSFEVAERLTEQLLQASDLSNQPYFRVVAPDSGKDTILIEQIRDLITFFSLKVPGERAIKRVAIVQDAHKMGHPAQNALLKLLEEPPIDSTLILTSPQPQSLLPTIRSRLQIIHLPRVAATPETEDVQLVKQALSGTAYDRLLLVDGPLKPRDIAVKFVRTLTTVSMAALEAAAQKQSANVQRWNTVLNAAHTADDALAHSGNVKLVLTELMLAL